MMGAAEILVGIPFFDFMFFLYLPWSGKIKNGRIGCENTITLV